MLRPHPRQTHMQQLGLPGLSGCVSLVGGHDPLPFRRGGLSYFFFAERAARAAGTGVSVDSRISMAGLSSDPCQRQGWGSSGLGRVPAFPAFPNRTQLVGNCRTLG